LHLKKSILQFLIFPYILGIIKHLFTILFQPTKKGEFLLADKNNTKKKRKRKEQKKQKPTSKTNGKNGHR
jgi:hypothetical protein